MWYSRALAVAGFVGMAAIGGVPHASAFLLAEGANPGQSIVDGDKRFDNFFCTTTAQGNTAGGCTTLQVNPLSPISGTPGIYITGLLSALALQTTEGVADALLDVTISYDFTVLDPNKSVIGLSLEGNLAQSDLNCPLCFGRIVERLGGTTEQLVIGVGGGSEDVLAAFLPIDPVKSGRITKDIELFSANPNNRVSLSEVQQNFA